MKIQLYQRESFARHVLVHSLLKGDVAYVLEYLPATEHSGAKNAVYLKSSTLWGETIDAVIGSASAVKPLLEDESL